MHGGRIDCQPGKPGPRAGAVEQGEDEGGKGEAAWGCHDGEGLRWDTGRTAAGAWGQARADGGTSYRGIILGRRGQTDSKEDRYPATRHLPVKTAAVYWRAAST